MMIYRFNLQLTDFVSVKRPLGGGIRKTAS